MRLSGFHQSEWLGDYNGIWDAATVRIMVNKVNNFVFVKR